MGRLGCRYFNACNNYFSELKGGEGMQETNEILNQVLIFGSILVPIISALVELLKKTINLPKNYVPLLSLVLGLLIGALAYPFTDFEITLRLWAGGLAGLSATGLFELFKPRKGNTKTGGEK